MIRPLPGEPIRQCILFARDVVHAPCREALPDMHYEVVQDPQVRIPDFILPVDLPGQELAIGLDRQMGAAGGQRFLLRIHQRHVLGDVVRGLADVFGKLSGRRRLAIEKDDADAGRAGIAATGAVDIHLTASRQRHQNTESGCNSRR